MAFGMREAGQLATLDHFERPCSPRVLIEKTKTGWEFSSPYRDEDGEAWEALLFQAFGTRSAALMNHFLNVFTKLIGEKHWDERRQIWTPDQDSFDAIIAMVHSMQPQNEAQAAYAAQLVALHVSAMKLGENCAQSYGDDRSRSILNKTVRAFGDGLERMGRLQGKIKPREVHQTIQVIYNDNRDQRMQFAGGTARNGGQAHGTHGWAGNAGDAESIDARPALPRPQSGGEVLRLSCGEGQAGLSRPWWGERIWRALGRAQR